MAAQAFHRADEYTQTAGVHELDSLEIDDHVVVAAIDQPDEFVTELRRGVDIDLSGHRHDRVTLLSLRIETPIHLFDPLPARSLLTASDASATIAHRDERPCYRRERNEDVPATLGNANRGYPPTDWVLRSAAAPSRTARADRRRTHACDPGSKCSKCPPATITSSASACAAYAAAS